MRRITKYLASVIVAMSVCIIGLASELPVKVINGKPFYYYVVRKGDSLLGIAHNIGVSREDIIKYNKEAGNLLRPGMIIYLPQSEFGNVITECGSRSVDSVETSDDGSLKYVVKKGDTVYGIAHRYGVTVDALIALNPSADTGIKEGEVLRIPASGEEQSAGSGRQSAVVPDPEPEPIVTDTMPEERRLTPVEPERQLVEEEEEREAVIGILLPLMLDETELGKQAKSATEFMKGFLLGAESEVGRATKTRLVVFDTAGKPDTIPSLLQREELADAQVIISPEDMASHIAVCNALRGSSTFVLNLFSVQDTTYYVNDVVMQGNIPPTLMYEKAVEAMLNRYEGYTPIFLICKGGRSEKLPFTDFLRKQYAEMEIEPIDLIFTDMLTTSAMESLDPEGRYVFIPASGSLSEFNKFARALITLRESRIDPTSIGVFGYPDWTSFRNDALDMLHRLNAMIYSRFYADVTDKGVTDFVQSFTQTYGSAPAEQVPSQAMLGYDCARYIFSNLAANNGDFDPLQTTLSQGIQSSFLFQQPENMPNAGPVNQPLYIITFMPEEGVYVQIL